MAGELLHSTDQTKLAKRIIACLDVRTNDQGDLVVTKGDQYNVREEGEVRNLGMPVELARRYFEEGADEITFLNITGFRDFPMKDQPMLEVLQDTSENVFVPLTIGGGIREFTDSNGKYYSALDVASEYFRSGADKISIGSDAVYIVEEYLESGKITGESSIEQISNVYGNQAVVISVDPRRVYVQSPDDTDHNTIKTFFPGPNGEEYCWYQCTVKGGREGRDVDALQLAQTTEKLGAGEILLNCIDKDGTNSGFDIELINHIRDNVSIPLIASSGAGKVEHFTEVFEKTKAEAALAAGIFHREEIPIEAVKEHMREKGIETR
jgi:glutamine amidotransferase/cyclase